MRTRPPKGPLSRCTRFSEIDAAIRASWSLETAEADDGWTTDNPSRGQRGRATTFLDFMKTAVDSGLHDKALVRGVLTGRAGRCITVVGRDGGREAVCASCERAVPRRMRLTLGDCDYEGRWYRYDA